MGVDPDSGVPEAAKLRRRAEDRLQDQPEGSASPRMADDALQLLHELQVHMVELEMQNAELQRTRHEVEAVLEKYTDLYDFAPVGYFTLDRTGTIRAANLTGASLLGVARARLVGRPLGQLIAADDRSTFSAFLEKVFADNGKEECEVEFIKEGAQPLHGQLEAMATAEGQECRIALIDITELHHARQELRKTEKLESLGVLAGGIAHDFNNLFTAILGNLNLARRQIHDSDQVALRLLDAESTTLRAKELALQLLTFSRGGEPVKKTFKVLPLIEAAVRFATQGSAVDCDFDLPDNLWPVEADEGQLGQVLQNLALNAVQAMPNGGKISIVARNADTPPGGKNFVKIVIRDTGPGIPEALMQKIFDPYFTTKEHGTGLGLAVCHSIVKKHGGKLAVESTLNQGASFSVYLPAGKPLRAPEPAARLEVFPGSGRVLVMDDQPAVRAVAMAMLEELGYQAECAATGEEAVDLYQKSMEAGSPFAAVIMDLTIPGGMGGKEAVSRILQLDPLVKAVVSSGYSTDPVMAGYRNYGFSAVLCKPYRLEEISQVLKDLLDPPS